MSFIKNMRLLGFIGPYSLRQLWIREIRSFISYKIQFSVSTNVNGFLKALFVPGHKIVKNKTGNKRKK